MRITLKICIVFILAVQCKNVEKTDHSNSHWLEVKKSRDYFDYITFIQKNPKSEHFEKALSEYFFLRDSLEGFLGCGRYNASISIVNEKQMLFKGELTNLDSLRFRTFEYLKNGIPNVSTLKYDIQIPQSNMWDSISKGHFDIVIYDKPFPIKSLKLALEEVKIGIINYKDFLSKKWYKKPYIELTSEHKIGIDELNDTRISFFDFSHLNGKRMIPPPPPDFQISEEDSEE